jgi:hypothetical protein
VTAGLLLAAALPAHGVTTGVRETGLPSAERYSATLLPEMEGIVPWHTLSGARTEPVGIGMIN